MKRKPPAKDSFRIQLVDLTKEDERPEVTVYAVDRSFQAIHVALVDEKGNCEIPEAVLKKAHRVVIGPPAEELATIDRKRLTQFRVDHFQNLAEKRGAIEVAKSQWVHWLQATRCVHGSVSHCFPYPWIISKFVAESTALSAVSRSARATPVAIADTIERDFLIDPQITAFPRFRCETVCDGLVEVYRRTCCCSPIIIDDPRIPEIIVDLKELVPPLPPIKRPPRPQPDPPPWEELRFFKSGAIDEKVLNARRDLEAIRSLSPAQQVEYIQARPYLFCSCGSATQVAQGSIQPNGEFHICWTEPLSFLLIHCHFEYAFVVKQLINGTTTVIYDGVASNQWFHSGETAALVSYHSKAIGCRHNDFPGEGAFALLQDIGDTPSYELATPNATGWDRVDNPAYNSGLAFPVAAPADALGKLRNRNWGGGLRLRYHFSEAMKGIGARFYRVSVVASDGSGNPTGPRTYLSDAVTWRKYVVIGTDIHVQAESLGPNSDGLFKIPYDTDADWQSGQYHAVLDTTRPEFPQGRYLLTLEVFDSAGNQLKPNSAPATDPGNSANFTFRRWFQEIGPTTAVPFGALTHMFWWDNRGAQAVIVDLRVNGAPNTDQCQFLEGPSGTQFSVGYRAYHPEAMFQLYHRLRWHRGLGGPSGTLTSPALNPGNVGKPPMGPGVSGTDTFGNMLTKPPGSFTKCSFSLNLYIWVKTTDGQGRLQSRDDSDQAAFAVEIS